MASPFYRTVTNDLSHQICTVHQDTQSADGSRRDARDLRNAIVAAAVHDGHDIRADLQPLLAVSERDRWREEDAFTSHWTTIAPTRVVGNRSRFEVDLNRPRHRAVYLTPADAWGLKVWKQQPSHDAVEHSLALYDAFYQRMRILFDERVDRHGQFFVYDLHSYNHQRGGPDAPHDAATENPQINLCTGGMDLDRCGAVVDQVEQALLEYDFPSGKLDVRRNVRFRATRFSRWVHENYPGVGISLAFEISKFYMDEWTGQPDTQLLHAITDALRTTVEPVCQAMTLLRST